MHGTYKSWSLHHHIFSINQSALALNVSARSLRTALQIHDGLFPNSPRDCSPLVKPRTLSFWDNLTITLLAENSQYVSLNGDTIQLLFDDLAELLPEESVRVNSLEGTELLQAIRSYFHSSHWERTLSPCLSVSFLSAATTTTFRKLDDYVQLEAI